jgi:hypothetical protein
VKPLQSYRKSSTPAYGNAMEHPGTSRSSPRASFLIMDLMHGDGLRRTDREDANWDGLGIHIKNG